MRLTGFDYSRPMFYMVTLKCMPGRQALSAIVEPGRRGRKPAPRYLNTTISIARITRFSIVKEIEVESGETTLEMRMSMKSLPNRWPK